MRKNKIQKFKVKLIYLYLIIIILFKFNNNIDRESSIVMLFFFIFVYIIYKHYRIKYLNKLTLNKIDKLKGEEFEEYLEHLYKKLGYKVTLTDYTSDYGADLILTKSRKKYVLQAKRWSSRVGVKAVQEVVASKNYYKANYAMVVTNSYFTKNAENLANVNDVLLIDRKELIKLMKEIK